MAPRLPKRVLQPSDLKDTQRLLEVFNPLLESYSALLAGGLSLDNVRQITVTAKVKPPDEWVPLELANGATPYTNPDFGAPAVRWLAGGTEYRGLVTRPAAGASFVPFARIPDTAATLRPRITTPLPVTVFPYASGAVEVTTAGALSLPAPSGFTAGGWIGLTGLRHASTPNPPPWAASVDVTLQGPAGEDYGTPVLVLVLGATRTDRVTCMPDVIPMWETPVTGEGGKRERKLRIRRLGGLDAGVEHLVTFLALYR